MQDPYGRGMRPNKLQVLGLVTVAALVFTSLAVLVGPVFSADAQGSAQLTGPRPGQTPDARPLPSESGYRRIAQEQFDPRRLVLQWVPEKKARLLDARRGP